MSRKMGDIRQSMTEIPTGVLVLSVQDAGGDVVYDVLRDGVIRSSASPTRLLVPISEKIGELTADGAIHLTLLSHQQMDFLRSLGEGSAPTLLWDVRSGAAQSVADAAACHFACSMVGLDVIDGQRVATLDVIHASPPGTLLPLLSFQGGMGPFMPGNMIDGSDGIGEEAQWVAELASEPLNRLAQDLQAEGCVMTIAGHRDVVPVSVTKHSTSARATRLGRRMPFIPPLGVLFVDSLSVGVSADKWVGRLPVEVPGEVREEVRRKIALTRARGWSVSLVGGPSVPEMDDLINAYSVAGPATAEEVALHRALAQRLSHFEPEEIHPDQEYSVLTLSVPIIGSLGDVVAMLHLLDLPSSATGSEIQQWTIMMKAVVHDIEERLNHRAEVSQLPRRRSGD